MPFMMVLCNIWFILIENWKPASQSLEACETLSVIKTFNSSFLSFYSNTPTNYSDSSTQYHNNSNSIREQCTNLLELMVLHHFSIIFRKSYENRHSLLPIKNLNQKQTIACTQISWVSKKPWIDWNIKPPIVHYTIDFHFTVKVQIIIN